MTQRSRQYWTERKKQQVGRETYAKQRLMLHQRQEYRCALCHIQFIPGESHRNGPYYPYKPRRNGRHQ